MSEKKKNGQQIAKETVARFDAWVNRMSNEDFLAIEYRGKIKRTEIMRNCDCGRPALTQNKKLEARIEKVEERLRREGVYPPKLPRKSESHKERSSEFGRDAYKEMDQKDHLSQLEHENLSLKAKVEFLERELSRYEELSDSLYELGNLTR